MNSAARVFGTTKMRRRPPQLPDYKDFPYIYKALTFDLRYVATTPSKQSCFLINNRAQPRIERLQPPPSSSIALGTQPTAGFR